VRNGDSAAASASCSLSSPEASLSLPSPGHGVPAGVIAGRRIWCALAAAIGVVDDWSFPWLSAILAAAVAVVRAVLPRPGGVSSGRVLRDE
jgi:hypothetical protein